MLNKVGLDGILKCHVTHWEYFSTVRYIMLYKVVLSRALLYVILSVFSSTSKVNESHNDTHPFTVVFRGLKREELKALFT